MQMMIYRMQTDRLEQTPHLVSLQTESTAQGSWSCATLTSSWGKGRLTLDARTHAWGWFSESTSTSPPGGRCPYRLHPTPSSAVSTSYHQTKCQKCFFDRALLVRLTTLPPNSCSFMETSYHFGDFLTSIIKSKVFSGFNLLAFFQQDTIIWIWEKRILVFIPIFPYILPC